MDRVGRVLLLVTIVCGALVVPGVAGAGPNDPTVLFGAYAKPTGGQSQQAALEDWEDAAQRQAAVVREYLTWNEDFPNSYHNWLAETGRVPMISLNTGGTNYDWADVAAAAPGSQLYNQIVAWAGRFREYGVPFYFTFDHEPEAASNNNMGSQQDYINAWRNVVNIFRAEGVDNATYLWITTAWAYGVGQNTRRYAPRWYPGDGWVDVLGADGYNWHDCRIPNNTNWRSLAQIINGFRQWATQQHPDKPLALPEYGTVEDSDSPNRKAQWYADARALFKQPGYEQFTAVLEFNGTGCEWAIDSSTQALNAFRAWGADVYYSAQGMPGSPSPVGITVDVSASPGSVTEPGGPVAFAISVTNQSPEHSVNLTALSDNRTGNLDGAGTCNVPTVIAGGGAYSCSHQVDVTGPAGSNYSVTVTAAGTSDGQAVSDTGSESVAIVGDVAGQVLFVVNNAASLTSGEIALRNRMTSLGYDVDTVTAATATAGNATGHAAVLVSASVSESAGSDKFRNVAQPVIIWKPWLYDSMDMSLTNGNNTTASNVTITDAAHPLAAGFSGSVTVVSPASLMARGTPGGDGHVVATVSGVAALFVYEAGDDLADGSAAAGCRIAYPLHTNTATALNANGWALFENALAWAVGGCAGAPPPPPPPPPPPGGEVLFVVANNGSLSGGDQAVVDRLEDAGHTVVVRGASTATTADAAGKALILISSNASTSGIGTKFRDVPQPIIIYKPFSYDAMEMTANDGGNATVTSINVTNATHPLAAGLNGNAQIVSASNRVATGSPSAGGTVVATASGTATLFVFESGDTLANGSPAPGCRIGFPAYHETPASYTANGWLLFDTAVAWSITGCGT